MKQIKKETQPLSVLLNCSNDLLSNKGVLQEVKEPIFITLLTCQFYSLWDIITYVIKMRTLTVKTRN